MYKVEEGVDKGTKGMKDCESGRESMKGEGVEIAGRVGAHTIGESPGE